MDAAFPEILTRELLAPNRYGIQPLEVMRRTAHAHHLKNKFLDPLADFIVVGAGGLNLNQRSPDALRFYQLFDYLLKSGLTISRDFRLDCPDLATNGRDYRRGMWKTDCTLFSHVDNCSHGVDQTEAFAQRLKRSQSKLIVSIYYGQEIDLQKMNLEDYMPLGMVTSYNSDPTKVRDLSLRSGQNWQMLGHKDYIDFAATSANAQTMLGQAMHAQALVLQEQAAKQPKRVISSPPLAPQR